MATKFQFDTNQLRALFTKNLQDVVAQELSLGKDQLQALAEFSAAVMPLIVQQTQEMVNSTDPSVQSGYIHGLVAAEIDKAAQLLGEQILAQRELIAQTIKTWALDFAEVLVTATGNPLLSILAGAVVTTINQTTG